MTAKRLSEDMVYVTVPNIITIARLLTMPFIVWAMLRGAWMTGFVLFVLAGISDGIDGFIARYFRQHSAFGAYIDPLADKALTIAVFWTFLVLDIVPVWLFVLIVARDIAILLGAGFMALRGKASVIRPLPISKVNTVMLIVLAGWLLASNAFGWSIPSINRGLIVLVFVLTAVSAVAYGRLLIRSLGDDAARKLQQTDRST